MANKHVKLTRGESIWFELPDGDTVEVMPCTSGQYRAAIALDDAVMDDEERIVRQCGFLAGEEVAERLDADGCRQVVRAMVCQYAGIDPNADKEMQALLKKKALVDLLLGTRRASESQDG